jgi:hypothetical protein
VVLGAVLKACMGVRGVAERVRVQSNGLGCRPAVKDGATPVPPHAASAVTSTGGPYTPSG